MAADDWVDVSAQKQQWDKMTPEQQAAYMESLERGGATAPFIDPIDMLPTAQAAKLGALIGRGAAGVVAKPAEGIAGWLMRKSLGLKNEVPGIGNELARQGLVGTRGMMERQASSRLPQIEAKVQAALQAAPPVNSGEAAARMADDLLRDRITKGGLVSSGADPEIQKILERASSVATRKEVPAGEALQLARQVETGAYKRRGKIGEVKDALSDEMAAAEGSAYKNMLKEEVPGTREALSQEQALILARNAAQKEPGSSVTVYKDIKDAVNPLLMSSGAQVLQRGVAPTARGTGAAIGGGLGIEGIKTLQDLILAQPKKQDDWQEVNDWQEVK